MPRRSRGEGTIEELPSGKYRASRSTGKGRERKTFDRKDDAVKWLRKAAEERRGEWARKPLAEWLDRWLTDGAGQWERATIKWYRDRVDRRIRPALGTIRLGDLSSMHVRDWMAAMVKADASNRERHGALKTLRTCLQSAITAGQLSRNVAKEGAKLPKLKTRTFEVWSKENVAQFLTAAQGADIEAYYWLALDTGMRPGELFGLHWSAVDLKAGVVHVRHALEWIQKDQPRLKEPKTTTGIRSILISPGTVSKLTEHRTKMIEDGVENGIVFLNRRGGWMRPKETADRLHALSKAAGVPRIRLYDLRHTSATLLLSEDVNVKVVSTRLGHTDIAITLRHYAGFLPGMQERAVSAMSRVLVMPTESPCSHEQTVTITELK